ncbi:hypothetical protein [Streptomyces sp. C]|uniref:hypothetical protein n=1 Tax=Streptomyces sp. C TaxID=253839 RepID=UPI0001B55CF3|nr:hypothetical protein [Streptomyces sp. C]
MPVRRAARDRSRPGGHGLVLLERLAKNWGSVPAPDGRPGKTVWLEVTAPQLPSAPQRP